MQIERQDQYVQITYRDLWERILGAASALADAEYSAETPSGFSLTAGPNGLSPILAFTWRARG
jgi:hypothetical protein